MSAVLAKDSNDFGQAIPVLAAFSRYSANTSGSGAFVDVAVPTLLIPDNLAVQCSAPGAYPEQQPPGGMPAMTDPHIYAVGNRQTTLLPRTDPVSGRSWPWWPLRLSP